jgi:hypothetical protein
MCLKKREQDGLNTNNLAGKIAAVEGSKAPQRRFAKHEIVTRQSGSLGEPRIFGGSEARYEFYALISFRWQRYPPRYILTDSKYVYENSGFMV